MKCPDRLAQPHVSPLHKWNAHSGPMKEPVLVFSLGKILPTLKMCRVVHESTPPLSSPSLPSLPPSFSLLIPVTFVAVQLAIYRQKRASDYGLLDVMRS